MLHELVFGIERLAAGRRRTRLQDYLDHVVLASIPILDYDQHAALWHARERARLASIGLSRPFVDGQIASIAAINSLTLITRNTSDFEYFDGLVVENWYLPPPSPE